MTVLPSDTCLSGDPPVADCSRISFSVAVCTYNGAERVGRVLEYLYAQKDTKRFGWEIIVIDNNSSDQTKAAIEHYQSAWRGSVPLRYCFEPRQGLAFARQCAVEKARGELIGFLDDDNLPEPDWVAKAFSFAQSHPKAGAYGSYIIGKFETEPPQNFERIASLLALTNRGDKPLFYYPSKKVLPPGAGLVVKKQAWLGNVPKSCFLQGRVAGHQLPGEDLEALLYIQKAGWEIWYNPEMTLLHCIPSWRLTPEYLLELCRKVGLSRFYTRMLSVQKWQRPAATLAYMGRDLVKVSRHLIRYRNRLDGDLIALCELKLYLNSLVSPFYLLRKQIGL